MKAAGDGTGGGGKKGRTESGWYNRQRGRRSLVHDSVGACRLAAAAAAANGDDFRLSLGYGRLGRGRRSRLLLLDEVCFRFRVPSRPEDLVRVQVLGGQLDPVLRDGLARLPEPVVVLLLFLGLFPYVNVLLLSFVRGTACCGFSLGSYSGVVLVRGLRRVEHHDVSLSTEL